MGVVLYRACSGKYGEGARFWPWSSVPDAEGMDIDDESINIESSWGWWPVVSLTMHDKSWHEDDKKVLCCYYQLQEVPLVAWFL